MVSKKIIFLLMFILLSSAISAFNITTDPEELIFEDILDGGYAEKIIKIRSDSGQPAQITISASEPISSWISFEPASASATGDSPAEFKIIVKPSGSALGTYQGYLIISTFATGNEITGAVSSTKTVNMVIELTDQQIMQAGVKDVVIGDTEENSPIKALVRVQNQGNIALTPLFQLDILDVSRSQVLKSADSGKKTILPYSTDVIEVDLPNDLPLGSYWAQVTTTLGDRWIIGKRLIKFNVVEMGTLQEEEKPIVLEAELMPLSLSWTMLITWVAILLFVMWVIGKKKRIKNG